MREMDKRTNVTGLSQAELVEFIEQIGEPTYRPSARMCGLSELGGLWIILPFPSISPGRSCALMHSSSRSER